MITAIFILFERLELAHPGALDEDEIAYLGQIRSVDDLHNFTSDGTGRFEALAYDAALALGLSKWDAMSVANDH